MCTFHQLTLSYARHSFWALMWRNFASLPSPEPLAAVHPCVHPCVHPGNLTECRVERFKGAHAAGMSPPQQETVRGGNTFWSFIYGHRFRRIESTNYFNNVIYMLNVVNVKCSANICNLFWLVSTTEWKIIYGSSFEWNLFKTVFINKAQSVRLCSHPES